MGSGVVARFLCGESTACCSTAWPFNHRVREERDREKERRERVERERERRESEREEREMGERDGRERERESESGSERERDIDQRRKGENPQRVCWNHVDRP